MINYIEGKLVHKDEGVAVVDCCGIGYEINVSANTLSALPFMGEMCKILTYMQVREDGITLFGFANKEERDMFFLLMGINGIGAKMAISILSGISLHELALAIANQDIKMLCTIKGLGKKTAERVLLELKDKVYAPIVSNVEENLDFDAINDATEALISLGVGKNEAYRLAKDSAAQGMTVEEIITKALRGMNN